MPIEYLGNKSRLLDFVLRPILNTGVTSVADLLCGTASVSQAFGQNGLRVIANDHMALCATLAEAALLAPCEPKFGGLAEVVAIRAHDSPYVAALHALNQVAPVDGFFHRTYSPASASSGTERMYLTEFNAAKVDAVRATIEAWGPLLTRGERALLLRDLVIAVSRVSNTAGTYGCYLKRWKLRALEPLLLEPRITARGSPRVSHEVHCDEVMAVLPGVSVDAAYFDPPYTKRQYAAYYHLLETLVRGDSPDVEGSTGLPRWQDQSSDFCYRQKAAAALARLVAAADMPHIFLSYSDEGQIPHERILEILRGRGVVNWWERSSPRYRSSQLRHRANAVVERLYHLALN